jgi:hypothetical protein
MPPEAGALRLRRLVVLAQRFGRPALPAALLGDPVAVVEVGDEIRPVAQQRLDAGVVEQRPVLDRADADSAAT